MKNLFFSTLTLLLLTLLSTCDRAQKHQEGDGHDHGNDHSSHTESDDHGSHNEGHDEHGEGGLHLSTSQAKTIGLEFGDFTSLKVNDFVKATGTLGLPTNAQSSISARAAGIIKGTKKFVEGA